MISYEEFEKHINALKNAQEFENDMLTLSRKYIEKHVLLDYIDVGTFYLSTNVVELLSLAMDVPIEEDEILNYWIYELDFGKKADEFSITDESLPEDHPYHNPKLNTTKELYDYMVFLAEQLKEEQ